MKLSTLVMTVVFLIVLAWGDTSSAHAMQTFRTPSGTGTLRKSHTLWILNLRGNYFDMGRQYGALFKEQLNDMSKKLNEALWIDNYSINSVIGAMTATMDPREKDLLKGIALESGLGLGDPSDSDYLRQVEFLNISIFFVYANVGCSAFAATGEAIDKNNKNATTIAGRNFDNPRGFLSTILKGNSVLVIYNPTDHSTKGGAHPDNSVAVMTQIGWIYGLTNLNSKGLYIEYNNGTNSIPMMISKDEFGNPILPNDQFAELIKRLSTQMDGLHQNFFASLDIDTLEGLDAVMLEGMAGGGVPAAATITQAADKTNVLHYERSPYEPSRKIKAGEATGKNEYANRPNTSIITNHFFFDTWKYQNLDLYDLWQKYSIDSGSKTFARLNNLQTLAKNSIGTITVGKMKEIMTTPLKNDATGGPFIGWELANPDVTHFTTVTDIAARVMYIYPYVDSEPYRNKPSVKWSRVDLTKEFR